MDKLSKEGVVNGVADKQISNAELLPFGKNIWVIEGPMVKDMGLLFSTRMIVVRMSDGSLWVCDPVRISDNTHRLINELGEIKYLLVTTQRHVWRLSSWHEKYPNAQLWSCANVPKKLKHLPYTGTMSDSQNWGCDFEQITIKGNKLLSEIAFCHKESKTLIMGDIVQNNEQKDGRPFTNFIFRISGAAYPSGGVGFDLKLTFTNRKAARETVCKILSWDFDKLIIAHGPCVTSNAKEYVKRAFSWL